MGTPPTDELLKSMTARLAFAVPTHEEASVASVPIADVPQERGSTESPRLLTSHHQRLEHRFSLPLWCAGSIVKEMTVSTLASCHQLIHHSSAFCSKSRVEQRVLPVHQRMQNGARYRQQRP
jgi:hypothetical protein